MRDTKQMDFHIKPFRHVLFLSKYVVNALVTLALLWISENKSGMSMGKFNPFIHSVFVLQTLANSADRVLSGFLIIAFLFTLLKRIPIQNKIKMKKYNRHPLNENWTRPIDKVGIVH